MAELTITKLRYLCLRTETPQYQIAALAGIHSSTFSAYCKGQREINSKHLIALCKLFKVDPEEVIGTVTLEGIELEGVE